MSPRYSQILFDNEKLHWKSLSQKIRTDTSKQRSQTTGQRKSEHVLRLAARIRSNETSSSIYIPEFRFWHEAGTINTFLLHFSIFIRYFSAGPDLHSE